uniref:Uncharacterized protein n=1 Tax=Strongyloides papillosus TaxID=174720 RepID=A0A0N5C8N2_STREA
MSNGYHKVYEKVLNLTFSIWDSNVRIIINTIDSKTRDPNQLPENHHLFENFLHYTDTHNSVIPTYDN